MRLASGLYPSLRVRLLLWLLAPLALFVIVTALASYESARRTADLMQDAALLASARTIIEDIEWVDGRPAATIPPAALEIFESPYQDQVFYKVVAAPGQLLGGSPDLALPVHDATRPWFYDSTLDGAPIRAVAVSRRLYDAGKVVPVTVVVAKTQASWHGMIDRSWRPQLLCECLMLLIVAALVPLGLTVELRPLMKLKDDVDGRKPMQIEAMPAHGLPRELRPIVDAINRCIAQLELHTQTQRQFVADAAHQLRTPLALLDAQLQYACRLDQDAPARAAALAGARRSTEKMKDLTSQLLLLAHAESAPAQTLAETDMAGVIASVLEELIVAAQRRDIDLGAEFGDEISVPGTAELLAALVANLVDNAIRYTQEGGRVTAAVRREGDWVVLQVIDNGPGIAEPIRAHVFERFYRGTTSGEGTGLGLAIVREIAHRHGGSVGLEARGDMSGTIFTVKLPAWRGTGTFNETTARRR